MELLQTEFSGGEREGLSSEADYIAGLGHARDEVSSLAITRASSSVMWTPVAPR